MTGLYSPIRASQDEIRFHLHALAQVAYAESVSVRIVLNLRAWNT